jgi:hypothetical protein
MALLILATVFIITVSIAEVVRTEMVSARASDYSIFATFAGESQLEESLHKLRKDPSTTVAGLNGATIALANGATSSVQAQNASSYLSIPSGFAQGQSQGFFLYDFDTGAAAGKESIKIYPYCSSPTWWFEVGYADWTPGAAFATNFQKFRYSCAGMGINDTVVLSGITASKAYQVYVKSLNATFLDGMNVYACDDDAATTNCNMPGVVSLTANGSYLGANRSMSLTMPRNQAVSGIYSYAVFSECQLIKDASVPSPAC